MSSPKVYRASARIASEYKSCPACAQRIRVGQPVVFLPPASDRKARPVAHHKGCVLHRMGADS